MLAFGIEALVLIALAIYGAVIQDCEAYLDALQRLLTYSHLSSSLYPCSRTDFMSGKSTSSNRYLAIMVVKCHISRRANTDICRYRAASALYGTLLLVLALHKAAAMWRESSGYRGMRLLRILIRDQAIYFVA